jgi:superfamily II DNA or RNA helicase
MKLRSALERSVDSGVRQRGAEYFHNGQVKVKQAGPHAVEAIVTGSSPYDVRLTREKKWLRIRCSCPYFEDHEICKHVWAAILAADAQQALRGPGGSLPNRLAPDVDIDDLLDEDFDDFEDDDLGLPEPPPPTPALTRPWTPYGAARPTWQPQPPPTWRDLMHQTAPAAVPAPLADEVLYTIDGPATVRTQTLTLEIQTAKRKKDGNLGKAYPMRLTRADLDRLTDPSDREILGLLASAADVGPLGGYWYGYSRAPLPSVSHLSGPMADFLLPLLCATGRFRLRTQPGAEPGPPLSWDDGEPWQFWLEVREEPKGYAVTGSLRRGSEPGAERLPTPKPELLLRAGFLFHGGRISRLDPSAFDWIALLRNNGVIKVPKADQEELLERLLTAPGLPHLELPESLQVETVRSPLRPRLRLKASQFASQEWPHAELSFLYDGCELPADSPTAGLFQRGERRLLLRDPEAERQAVARLVALGLRPSGSGPSGPHQFRVPPKQLPKVIRSVLADGWSVEAQGKLYRSAGGFKMGVTSGVDWFELHGEMDFEGQTARLPDLLAALQRGDGFVPLGDGTLGLLPEDWLRRLGMVAGLGRTEGDHVRFQSAQACLLDAWLACEPEATCDETFARARRRLQRFEGIEPAEAPPGFQGELRGYQRTGLGWLHFLRDFGFGGCLADDMGLGKTVQVLALLEARRVQRRHENHEKLPPSLVVAPRSLIFNWLAEAARFTPQLRVLDYTGTGRPREGDDPFAGWDVVLTTYGTLRRDVATLRQIEFDYVILDEAQAIKNASSQSAKAARLLRGRHRLALSGTPIENHLGELWSLLEFLNPGLLGTSTVFKTQAAELRDPSGEARSLLARALRPFLLRRTKEQVAPELPAKLEQTLFCELPPQQRRLYDEMRNHYRRALGAKIGQQGLGRTKIQVLEALLRLRQAACHPGLLDRDRENEPSAKLDLLMPQLSEILEEGHKALVFSQFTSFLALLRKQLEHEKIPYLYLDGQTGDRGKLVEAFQNDPNSKLFLISLKAGGLGLNLTAADYVYLLDPWWNPAVEAQAIDRTHRIGQTRPVFAYRLVARDTVEEKILELQKSKRELADAIIQADKSLLATLSREDLELLLS